IGSTPKLPENNPEPVGSVPPPGLGIPIFPIKDYRFYLRITKVEATDTGFVLALEVHRLSVETFTNFEGQQVSSHWEFEGAFTAQMVPAAAPFGYLKPELFFTGNVFRADGSGPIGRMQIGWVSSYLRAAAVEIGRVPDSETPENNGAGLNWQSVF